MNLFYSKNCLLWKSFLWKCRFLCYFRKRCIF